MSRHFATTGPEFDGFRAKADGTADRCRTCDLRGSAICVALSEANPRGISVPTLRRFGKGELIFEHGAAPGLGVIRRGYARRSTCRLDGKRVVHGIAIPGDIVCGMTCRAPDCDLEAATEVEICVYDRTVLHGPLQSSPRALSQLLQSMDDQHHRLLDTLWQYGALASRERIIAFLVAATAFMPTEPQPDGSVILSMEIDRRDWADLTNTALETISRTLRYLGEKRLVTALSPYRFRIEDLERLALIAGIEPTAPGKGAKPAHRMITVNAMDRPAGKLSSVPDSLPASRRGRSRRRPEDVKEEIGS